MALTKRATVREITIAFDENGAFVAAFRTGSQQVLEDGVLIAEREGRQPRSLAQVKAEVAAL